MKKWVILIFCALLLAGCSSPEHSLFTIPTEETTEFTAEVTTEITGEVPTQAVITTQTTVPEETEPLQSNLFIPGVTIDDVITYFNEVCLDAEMVKGGNAKLIQKWDVPIYYYIFGEPTEDDLIALNDFETWVNTVPGFPGLSATQDLGQANMKIYFCTEQELHNIMGPGFENLDGAVTYWYNNNAIYDATICIRTDLNQYLRNSVIKEELYNGLGPINDTSLREDSIIYANYSEPQYLTDIDKLIMTLLYDPTILCGMNADRCETVLRQLYY